MRELATCLLHTKAESGSSSKAETASARMQQLTAEASALMARMLLDPRMHKALMHGRMDEGSPTPNRLDEAFYHNLVVCFDAITVTHLALTCCTTPTKNHAMLRLPQSPAQEHLCMHAAC